MKKKLITLVISAALGFFAGFSAKAAAGDIYDICPCDVNGMDLPGALTDYAHPLDAGSDIYFKVRLIARQANGNRWYIKYLGLGDDITMNALYPMQIGIYVSGRREYATLVEQREAGLLALLDRPAGKAQGPGARARGHAQGIVGRNASRLLVEAFVHEG